MENLSTILILLGFYTAIFFLIVTIKTRPGICSYYRIGERDLSRLNGIHILDVVTMLIPTWIIPQPPTFLLIFPDKISIAQAVAFFASFGFISLLPWRKLNARMPDEIVSTTSEVYGYAASRILFLVAYEWFFRGLLLMSLCKWLGIEWGITANILAYTAIHFYKGRKEMIGCIPLGIFLCAFTLWWHSIWPAIIFHVQVAIINEWPPLKQFMSSQKQAAL